VTGASFLQPGQIGRLALPNRLVRAATSESMATSAGAVTERHLQLYGDLARGGAGLLITGHIFVEPRGQYAPHQLGLHHDGQIDGFRRLTGIVHENGGRILAELSHAGSQSTMPQIEPIAPSMIPNAIFSRVPKAMTVDDIAAVVDAFGNAARRAVTAGFDGIHIHSGNGYLLAQFNSPLTNRRADNWGGNAENRGQMLGAVYDAVRSAVGPELTVTARVGIEDAMADGLSQDEGIERVRRLRERGLDGVEVTYGLMRSYTDNIRPYVAVTSKRALSDLLPHRLFAAPAAEAYYRPFAQAVKARVDIPVILVGGLRTTQMMHDVIASGDADFIAMARPMIREPDLPNQLVAGRRGLVDCVSCNICLAHEGRDGLRCWRKSWPDLVYHAYCRFWRDR
jgi:2,4-dienoyl-CoA reductase-like NADH-dependent reductase (Old Yellow Enzyme family)